MPSSKRFFKVILSSILHDHKLSFPDVFVDKHGDELSDLVRLEVPTGSIWFVKANKVDETIWLHEGLRKFFEDHSVGFGYILMFKYKGGSTFRVNIFNLTASEIEYHNADVAQLRDLNQVPTSEPGVDEKDDGDDISVEYLGCSTNHQQLGKSVPSCELASGNNRYRLRKRLRVQDEEISSRTNSISKHRSVGSKVSPQLYANMCLPKSPSLKVILKPYNFTKSILSLPSRFTKSFLSRETRSIKIQDVNNNEWEVRCILTSAGGCNLCSGLKEFLDSNDLTVGDVCVFESILLHGEAKLKFTKRHKIEGWKTDRYQLRSEMQNGQETISNNEESSSTKTCRSVGSKDSPKHLHANKSLPKTPSYKVLLKPYNFTRNILSFPSEFAKSYLSSDSQFIKILDDNNNEWEVCCKLSRTGGCNLYKGLKRFLEAMDLNAGEVCIFEPVLFNGEVKLKLSRAEPGVNENDDDDDDDDDDEISGQSSGCLTNHEIGGLK